MIFAFFERVILCPRQFNAGIIQSESKTNAKLFFAKPVSWIVLSTHYLAKDIHSLNLTPKFSTDKGSGQLSVTTKLY